MYHESVEVGRWVGGVRSSTRSRPVALVFYDISMQLVLAEAMADSDLTTLEILGTRNHLKKLLTEGLLDVLSFDGYAGLVLAA